MVEIELQQASIRAIYAHMLHHLGAGSEGYSPVDQMPPDTVLIEEAGTIVGVTAEDPPTFRARLVRASGRHDREAVLLRYGVHDGRYEMVTADIAVPVRSRNSIALLMDYVPWTDGRLLWLVPLLDGPFISVGAYGLRAFEEAPFRDDDHRDGGVLEAIRHMLGRSEGAAH